MCQRERACVFKCVCVCTCAATTAYLGTEREAFLQLTEEKNEGRKGKESPPNLRLLLLFSFPFFFFDLDSEKGDLLENG